MVSPKELVRVIDESKLFDNSNDNSNDTFVGFKPSENPEKIDFRTRILSDKNYMEHDLLNVQSNLKQIIVCYLIVNPVSETVSIYKNRSGTKHGKFPESGPWTCGYVEHLKNIDDALNNPLFKDPIFTSGFEELKNQISVSGILDVASSRLLGYIHHNYTDHSRAHFGLLYVIPTTANVIVKKDVLANRMVSLNELEKMVKDSAINFNGMHVDYWTSYALDPLKDYMGKR